MTDPQPPSAGPQVDEYSRDKAAVSVAREELIDIAVVNDRILDTQSNVSRVAAPAVAYAFLTLLVLDIVGNILGVPVITGLLLAGSGKASVGLAVTALLLQGVALAVVVVSLLKSPWRFWLTSRTDLDDSMFKSNSEGALENAMLQSKKRFQSLFGKVATQRKQLRSKLEKQPNAWGRVLPPAVAVSLIVLGDLTLVFAWRVAVVLLLLGVLCIALSDEVVKLVRRIGPRIRRDYGSSIGILVGVALAFVLLLLGGGEGGGLQTFWPSVWIKGDYFAFRILEIFLLGLLVVIQMVHSVTSLRHYQYFRAQQRTPNSQKAMYVWDFQHLATWPTFIRIDPETLGKVIVLGRTNERDYELVDYSLRLPLLARSYAVLDLNALQYKVGDLPRTFSDAGDFFDCTIHYVIQPKSFEGLGAGLLSNSNGVLPDRAVSLILEELFKSESPRAFLDRISSLSLAKFMGEENLTAKDLEEKYTEVASEAREASMLTRSQLSSPECSAGSPQEVSLGIIGYEQERSSWETFKKRAEEPRALWARYRQKRQRIGNELPAIFQATLREYFLETISMDGDDVDASKKQTVEQTVDCLLAASGIAIVVNSCTFASECATRCEDMMQTIEEEHRGRMKIIDNRIAQQESAVLDMMRNRMTGADEHKREVVLQLIKSTPKLLPIIMSDDVGKQFTEYLLRLGQSALDDKVKSLGSLQEDDPAEIRAILEKTMAEPTEKPMGTDLKKN